MEFPQLEPLVHSTESGLRLSYELPHRVYSTKVYPIQSPNGSTIIIYGHDTGIHVLWRGGKRIKPYKEEEEKENIESQNDGNDDVIMIIDSDEEDDAQAEKETPAPAIEFEEEEDEIDPNCPFLNIIARYDIHLGVKVSRVSIPSILPDAIRSPDSVPQVLSKTILITACCADSSVRLIAAPIIPPPPADSPYSWDLQTLTIPSQSIQAIPPQASMTITCERPASNVESRSRSRSNAEALRKSTEKWKLLVAVHSAEASGKLSIYQIPFNEQETKVFCPYTLSNDHLFPVQQLYLASPATSVSFNPSQFPSYRHAFLLLGFETGSVDLYSCLPPDPRNLSTADKRKSKADVEKGGVRTKLLFTFFTDFDSSSAAPLRRKGLVDARWVLGGRAIMALTTEGEWGLWDIELSGSNQKNLIPGSSVSAGQLGLFALRGRVSSPEALSKPQSTRAPPVVGQHKSKFAPMTPSTRRIREEALFKGSPQHSTPINHSYRGGISVIPTNQGWDKPVDESILIWHGDKNIQIPSLLSLWKASNSQLTVSFDSPRMCKPSDVKDIDTLGELETGISYISTYSPSPTQSLCPDIIITAESRLIILASKLRVPETKEENEHREEHVTTGEVDQTLLQKGELDLDGMDRVLAGMADSIHGGQPNLLRNSQNTFFA
ncbi:hypothetical protein LOZ53_005425 [Ophidiomyces ophidiicola]|nr:hypothetical protein LOZ55_001018 [Ophidiomyces ophidiicola]KAI1982093.1 hypothetical protein LOZ54_005457 [Ophidiomyces ophidiicola]KAI1984563.1 hypothetical protein LOZ53_005425 [Ophidiomyces ophidiicola]KAI1990402.1 hypothetical protein LOZ51_004753 [Ophidiomyces ophidiicola]